MNQLEFALKQVEKRRDELLAAADRLEEEGSEVGSLVAGAKAQELDLAIRLLRLQVTA